MADKQSFPTFSEKNWWVLKQQFKASIPSSGVSTNYLKTLLSLTSNAAANNCISNLKRLGILDEEGRPTQLANEWRIDESYKNACEKMLKGTYPSELLDLFPERDVDRTKAKNWFMSQNGVGDNMAGQMTALFVLLKSGEIKDVGSTNGVRSSPKKKAKELPKNKTAGVSDSVVQEQQASNSDGVERNGALHKNNRPNLHIDLQIHISPDSSPEQIETIFASMAKHLYGVDNS